MMAQQVDEMKAVLLKSVENFDCFNSRDYLLFGQQKKNRGQIISESTVNFFYHERGAQMKLIFYK